MPAWIKNLTCALSAATLAGCAVADAARPGLRTVEPGEARVVFAAPAFRSAEPGRVAFADIHQREEYARFEGVGARAELVHISTRHYLIKNLIIDGLKVTEPMARGWSFIARRNPVFEEARKVETGWATFWIRPFRAGDPVRSCFALTSEWDYRQEDPLTRPEKALFGYYCAEPGGRLNAAETDALVAAIGVNGVNLPRAEPFAEEGPLPTALSQAELERLARGGAADDFGNPAFPFMLVRIYVEGGERCSRPPCV